MAHGAVPWSTTLPSEPAPARVCPELPGESEVEVQRWLDTGCYLDWPAESGVMPSTMARGSAQVFINPSLHQSLKSGNEHHPLGAAAVRVMYTEDGNTHRGYSISIKVSNDDLTGWFWYEQFDDLNNGHALTASRDARGCVGCHSHGTDFVQSAVPLR